MPTSLICQVRTCPSKGTFLGKHDLEFRSDDSLQERFGNLQLEDQSGEPELQRRPNDFKMSTVAKVRETMIIHVGDDSYVDVKGGIEEVSERDYPQLNASNCGVIVVPQYHQSQFPETNHLTRYREAVKEIDLAMTTHDKKKAKELKSISDFNRRMDEARSEEDSEKLEKIQSKAMRQLATKHETYKELQPLTPEESEMVENFNRINTLDEIKGEETEYKIYKKLQAYLKEHHEEAVVFHGLKFMGATHQEEIEYQEKDFLVVNMTHRYILNLEVKATLTKNSLTSAKKQLNGCKGLIDEWLGANLSKENGWKFISMIYFDDKDPRYNLGLFCASCRPFLIIGNEDNFEQKFEKGTSQLQPRGNEEAAREEFKIVSKYLLFCSAFEPMTTPSKMTQKGCY